MALIQLLCAAAWSVVGDELGSSDWPSFKPIYGQRDANGGMPSSEPDHPVWRLPKPALDQYSRTVQRFHYTGRIAPKDWPDWMVAEKWRLQDEQGNFDAELVRQVKALMQEAHEQGANDADSAKILGVVNGKMRIKVQGWQKMTPEMVLLCGREIEIPHEVIKLRSALILAQLAFLRTPDGRKPDEALRRLNEGFERLQLSAADAETAHKLLTSRIEQLFCKADAEWVEKGILKYRSKKDDLLQSPGGGVAGEP